MSRAVDGQDVIPITKIMFQSERPSTAASTMASGKKGITKNHSVTRISDESTLPPTNPEVIPTAEPMRIVSRDRGQIRPED